MHRRVNASPEAVEKVIENFKLSQEITWDFAFTPGTGELVGIVRADQVPEHLRPPESAYGDLAYARVEATCFRVPLGPIRRFFALWHLEYDAIYEYAGIHIADMGSMTKLCVEMPSELIWTTDHRLDTLYGELEARRQAGYILSR